VVLPEDYKEITSKSNLVGYYNKRQDKLYIAFTNDRKNHLVYKNIDSACIANQK